jgi:carboxyl-terminal processing protease
MSLKLRALLAVSIGVILGISLSLGTSVMADRAEREVATLPWEHARLLAEVLDRVRRDYVDDIDDERLIEAAIRGMVADLDPHSAYLDAEEYQEIRVTTSGNYSGIGLEVSVQDGRVVVVSPVDGSPAAEAGIRPGDVVISVDGMPVDAGDLHDTILRLRGDPGTYVTVGLTRNAETEPLSYNLRRTQIRVRSVRFEMLEPQYGYVRVSHFSETTGPDVAAAVRELQQAAGGLALKGLVLDLRDNPGGVLDAAVEVADAFLDAGTIVTADGRIADARFRYDAEPGDLLSGAPLTVLVNGGSASASEIVAVALHDNRRAVVVGQPTFGKGSVQTVMPLSQGRAIKLTTSRYFTPLGRSIHERGIAPDIMSPVGVGDDDPQLVEALRQLKERRLAVSEGP